MTATQRPSGGDDDDTARKDILTPMFVQPNGELSPELEALRHELVSATLSEDNLKMVAKKLYQMAGEFLEPLGERVQHAFGGFGAAAASSARGDHRASSGSAAMDALFSMMFDLEAGVPAALLALPRWLMTAKAVDLLDKILEVEAGKRMLLKASVLLPTTNAECTSALAKAEASGSIDAQELARLLDMVQTERSAGVDEQVNDRSTGSAAMDADRWGHRISHGVPVMEHDQMTIRMTVRAPGNICQPDWVDHLRLPQMPMEL
ncbi:hypothetical protein FOA52_008690 [Chlamydomonas sp. UWO 241]|nr:hypothetical protein FOA52_008690 [Chlamydomonas sp. UWO 241]